MFSFLSFANSDFEFLQTIFEYLFNINEDTFQPDSPIHENFETKGFESKRFIKNNGSLLCIIVAIIIVLPFVLILKNFLANCYAWYD